MRIKLLAIAVASIALISSAAAALQADNPYGGGTRLTGPRPADIPAGAMSEEDRARIVTQQLAACLVKAHRTAVLKAIQVEPWQPGAQRLLENAVDSKCLERGALTIPPDLLRGAFYQQLYRETFASRFPVLAAKSLDFTASISGNMTDDEKTQIAMRQFGDCVARSDLNDANMLILSGPGAEQESYALNALMPHFSACLVQGSKWTLNRSTISAILSEVIYREAASAGTSK